ncbi:BadF/BadG/BcrA/BcrD ATPase family protein [Yoonia sp.]|uniref:BadF/BadG/BcrA/BcrD ATPase family protein n=1 Tax=Yoonia sp. TaxID=2212373 RepID=UPI0035C83C5E
MDTCISHILFGVDGGGTGCRVAARDISGQLIGETKGGPANFASDKDQTIANVRGAIAKLARDHAISADILERSVGHVGLAGVMSDDDAKVVAAAMPFGHAVVSDDRMTSLEGALGGGFGILAAIGTGSLIAARLATGARSFGGWGLQLGDQASGAWLGREALRRTVLAHDGLAGHSDLTRTLLAQYHGTLPAMIAFAARATPGDFAAHARLVVDGARAGDANATALMQRGADYLNACLGAADPGPADPLYLSGGVGPHYADYIADHFRARIRAPRGTALEGALALARQAHEEIGKTT